ncbi:hypothetical protein [Pseudomonas sp. B22129]|uniref:hypothetical protein n=1 Tax=Pseudomonas sp. B22129 TaxID=3235111 RepID=UPI0037847107
MPNSSKCPHSVPATPQGCHEHPQECCGEPIQVHVHVHLHRKCRSSAATTPVLPVTPAAVLPVTPAAPVKPPELPTIRIGYTDWAIGYSVYPALPSQIKALANYGPVGIYNKLTSVAFLSAMADITASSLTAAQLKDKYEIISLGLHSLVCTVAQAERLKAYVDLGGVLIMVCDHGISAGSINVLKSFGHIGPYSVSSALGTPYTGQSSATESLSNYFGDSRAVQLKGHAGLEMKRAQLPPGSKVLAEYNGNVLAWEIGGTNGGALAFCDIQLTEYQVAGVDVDNGQERFLNNAMAYLFDRVIERNK